METQRVYAVAKDTYWLKAVTESADRSVWIKAVHCHKPYPDCLEEMPAPDGEALLLVDATGQPEVVEIVKRLLAAGWRYVVVVAADPTWKEAHAVLKLARGYDYWEKSYEPLAIQGMIKVWQEEIGASTASPQASRLLSSC